MTRVHFAFVGGTNKASQEDILCGLDQITHKTFSRRVDAIKFVDQITLIGGRVLRVVELVSFDD